MAALPPSLRTLTVGDVGGCAEGAALVVPLGRTQQLELRCIDSTRFNLRTGQAAVGDVRAFMGWHRGHRFGAFVLGACAVKGWHGSTAQTSPSHVGGVSLHAPELRARFARVWACKLTVGLVLLREAGAGRHSGLASQETLWITRANRALCLAFALSQLLP